MAGPVGRGEPLRQHPPGPDHAGPPELGNIIIVIMIMIILAIIIISVIRIMIIIVVSVLLYFMSYTIIMMISYILNHGNDDDNNDNDISSGLFTPNLPTNIILTKIRRLKIARQFPMDMRIPPPSIKILLESNPHS